MPAIRDARTEGFTIGKLSDLTGVNIETIRYYEKIGMLPAPPRTESGPPRLWTCGIAHSRVHKAIPRIGIFAQ
jgi:hypothetical protein